MSTAAMFTKRAAVPKKWDATHIPSLQGQVAIVTGANSGIGYETALELARKGATVVLACRSEERGEAAQKKIQQELSSVPSAGKVELAKLDVSSLKSVQEFSTEFLKTHGRLDLLINNAGNMAVPYSLTVDGYENQFATNHLGHFALTAQLFDLIKKSAPSRIVNITSGAHHNARINEDAIMIPEERYVPMAAYADSKMCNILFTKELVRRIDAAGIQGVTAAVVHPGLANTNVAATAAAGSLQWRLVEFIARLVFSSPSQSALPTLYAATAANVQGGDFVGRDGFMNLWGYPQFEEPSAKSESKSTATKLWTLSERLASLSFDVGK